ncbi:unnamed protein product [Rotaria sp. Silwood2]|nr:unnamed protein product [Rotaria sp. Silwood2]CAF2823825.1 unnamed protein product [Rotaria sp. Silwood2]CAF3154073.1 unnamed protein product [Rotaria sp. Silwood2]CAF3266033.1 unnamed protein product [Rotaria sp. Silwood2]CAF4125987.1 unnamed protein product [Rotaria sp. Silwood2]
MATVTSTNFLKNELSSTDIHHYYPTTSLNPEHFIDERYPKTYFDRIPSVTVKYPPTKLNNQTSRSRQSLRFRTQPVTLTEIYEADEENNIENDNQQDSKTKVFHNSYNRLGHFTLMENIRHTERKKMPLKNFLKQQRLKTTQEELCEIDDC